MEEKDRCWCGSMLKDKPHNCIGTRSRVEGLLTEVRLLQDAIDKSNVALEEAIKTKEERDRLLLQVQQQRYGDGGLKLLFKIQEACAAAGIASGLLLGSEILLREYEATKLQKDEILKEFKFRDGLATLWISQLRQALGEAMDVLASDPDHDVALQARLELTRRAVDCTEKRSCDCGTSDESFHSQTCRKWK